MTDRHLPPTCYHCGRSKLASPHEDRGAGEGTVVICGQCGSIGVLSFTEGRLADGVTLYHWTMEKPGPEELADIVADPVVARWQEAFTEVVIEGEISAAAAKGPKTWAGPRMHLGPKA